MGHIRSLILSSALLASVSGIASELPVTVLNGQQYFYYKASKGESVYGISKSLGLTREQIVEYNPAVADGIRAGAILYFPVADFPQLGAQEDVIGDDPASEMQNGIAQVADTVVAPRRSITLALPLMLEDTVATRATAMYNDFVRGFLMGAKETQPHTSVEIDIKIQDTGGEAPVAEDSLAIIIVGESPAAISGALNGAAEKNALVANFFNFKDTLCQSSPYGLSTATPHKVMYRKAVDALMADFPAFTPVILRNTQGRTDKEAFVEYLTDRYSQTGIVPLEIDYQGALLASRLAEINADTPLVFIPASGSVAEFHKFAYALQNFMADRPAGSVALFGYPDWTAFRGEPYELLHKLDARVYSRFFEDINGNDTKRFATDFRKWYGVTPAEGAPNAALMGYDAARLLIPALQQAGDSPVAPETISGLKGLQMPFSFVRDSDDSGYYNSAIYIIRYRPDGTETVTLK